MAKCVVIDLVCFNGQCGTGCSRRRRTVRNRPDVSVKQFASTSRPTSTTVAVAATRAIKTVPTPALAAMWLWVGPLCDPTFVCTGGACGCPSGETDCAGSCTDTETDFDNCGGCGETCDTDTADACLDGECVCGSGAECGAQVADGCVAGECVCGDDPACTGGQLCVNGSCVTPCIESGETCEANAECCSETCTCGENDEA